MNVSVQIDVDEDGFDDLADNIDGAIESGLDAVAEVTLAQKQAAVARTYANPIPSGQNGEPKWTRSGALAREQTIESVPGERRVGPRGQSEAYEPRLAHLSSERRNDAASDAQQATEPEVESVFEAAFTEALGR